MRVVDFHGCPADRVGGALIDLPARLGGVPLERLRVPAAAIAAAERSLSPQLRAAPEQVIPRARRLPSMLGLDEIYAVGVAQAIAALALGIGDATEERSLPPVDLITGPGNVCAAKRLLHNVVAVDMEAGATEIMIIADRHADPALIAADMDCQTQHEEDAAAILVTDSSDPIVAASTEIQQQSAISRQTGRVRTALTGLDIHTADADGTAGTVRSAGAIFIGASTPVSLGDYAAGSNHVLPTGGTASFSSGLTVYTFLRAVQTVHYSLTALQNVREAAAELSGAEDLPSHVDALEAHLRFHQARAPHRPLTR